MRRVVGPTAACDKLRCRLEGSRVVVCVLHAGAVLQLSALHGHRIPRLPPLRRVREIPVLYRSRSGAAGLCRADGTSLVPAAAVDFHAVYLLESLALHRPEFRNFDDVCSPRGTLANKSRERGAAPCFHGLVSDAALQLPYGALGRRAYSFLGTASKVHLARARHARPIFHRGQRMGISFACEAQQLESAVADGDAGDHTVPVVLVARSDRARERPGSAADPLLQRDPGAFALGPVSLDYQLLPEKRGARDGSDLLEFRALPARTGGGGIALFVPGPWIVSRLFHADFAASFLTFTALVNLHHFMLDGAIWKLRDSRVAALLLDSRERLATKDPEARSPVAASVRWLVGRTLAARALRVGTVVVLLVWGGMDRLHFYWANV